MSTSSPRLLRRARGQRTRRRGAVYVEAIIVFTTLILLFALIRFVHDGFSKASLSGTDTRAHGWAHVMEPCDNGVPSPTQQRRESSWGVASLGSLAFIALDEARLLTYQSGLALYAGALTFKIDSHRFSQSASLGRPSALGGDARYGHQIVLTCDEDLDSLKMSSLKFAGWIELAWFQAGL